MSLYGTYENDNIIAKLIRGELPISTVYEDDRFLAFMDIFPESRGHFMVVPKYPARNFLELPTEWVGPYLEKVQWLGQIAAKALQPDGIRVVQFNGAEASQCIFHVHFHIIPAYAGVPLKPHGKNPADRAELDAVAAQIRAAL